MIFFAIFSDGIMYFLFERVTLRKIVAVQIHFKLWSHLILVFLLLAFTK